MFTFLVFVFPSIPTGGNTQYCIAGLKIVYNVDTVRAQYSSRRYLPRGTSVKRPANSIAPFRIEKTDMRLARRKVLGLLYI